MNHTSIEVHFNSKSNIPNINEAREFVKKFKSREGVNSREVNEITIVRFDNISDADLKRLLTLVGGMRQTQVCINTPKFKQNDVLELERLLILAAGMRQTKVFINTQEFKPNEILKIVACSEKELCKDVCQHVRLGWEPLDKFLKRYEGKIQSDQLTTSNERIISDLRNLLEDKKENAYHLKEELLQEHIKKETFLPALCPNYTKEDLDKLIKKLPKEIVIKCLIQAYHEGEITINNRNLIDFFLKDHHLINNKNIEENVFQEKRDFYLEAIEKRLEFLNLIKEFTPQYLKDYYQNISVFQNLFKLERHFFSSIPYYRDHSIHQFIVALLMLFFLEIDYEGPNEKFRVRNKDFLEQKINEAELRNFYCPFRKCNGELLLGQVFIARGFKADITRFYSTPIPGRQKIEKEKDVKYIEFQTDLKSDIKLKGYKPKVTDLVNLLMNFYNSEALNLITYLCGFFHDLGYPLQNWKEYVLQINSAFLVFREFAKEVFEKKYLMDGIEIFSAGEIKTLFSRVIDDVFRSLFSPKKTEDDKEKIPLTYEQWNEKYDAFRDKIVRYIFRVLPTEKKEENLVEAEKEREVAGEEGLIKGGEEEVNEFLRRIFKVDNCNKSYHFRHDILSGLILYNFWEQNKDELRKSFHEQFFYQIEDLCNKCSLKDEECKRNYEKIWGMVNADSKNTDSLEGYANISEIIEEDFERIRVKEFLGEITLEELKNTLKYFQDRYKDHFGEDMKKGEIKDFFCFIRDSYLDEVMYTIIAAITFHALEYKDKDFKVERYKFDSLGKEFTLERAFDWKINPFLVLLIFCDTIHWFEREEYGEVAEIRHSPSEMYLKIHVDPLKVGETENKILFAFEIEYHFTNINLHDPELKDKDRHDVDFYINEMERKFKTFNLKTLPFGVHIQFIDTKNLRRKELSLNRAGSGKIELNKKWKPLPGLSTKT